VAQTSPSQRSRSPRLLLDTPVTYLKGVGPARAEALRRLGVATAGDLLFHIPHRYEDASTVSPISSLETGMHATVIGRVISKGIIPTRKGLRIFQAVLRDASGMIEAAWPGQPYLDRTIQKGDTLLVSGSVRFFHGRQLQPREFINLGDDEDTGNTAQGRVLSVYPATEGLSFKVIRSIIDSHLDGLIQLIDEYLPREVLTRAGVPSIRDALRMVHRPSSLTEAMEGRGRLAFDELFFVHVLHQRAKSLAREARRGIRFENKRDLTSRLRQALPYELTAAQVRASREIFADMCSDRRMHRLLQGDVGSGKTIVALFSALLAMENGYQAALMAPTELLAEQHAQTFRELLNPLGIDPVLVTGSMSAKERKHAAERMESTEPAVIVGTHALVQQGTTFGKLGLAVVDEQHRFGVEQRKLLGAKGAGSGGGGGGGDGSAPDVLLMSATPIPRSLALTLYGDLDLSTLDERPPGRRSVVTALRPGSGRDRVLSFVNRQLDEGRQAYIVYPVIAESEKTDLKAATTMFEALSGSGGAFADRRVALLHGRIPADQRDAIMREFRDGRIQVLVATTVIEVGIDVSNASVMVIEHPERFGLSQLHQLRGRVGRGAAESFCILLGDLSPEVRDRLELFVRTDDGFEIARADLRLRGMGDLFGERQSGVPTFRVADPMRDEELNARARDLADQLLTDDPELSRRDHAGLRSVLNARYSRSLELFRVG
jgi:ATP-dependent DNA helicase RecG